jgi:hypothetical protein
LNWLLERVDLAEHATQWAILDRPLAAVIFIRTGDELRHLAGQRKWPSACVETLSVSQRAGDLKRWIAQGLAEPLP